MAMWTWLAVAILLTVFGSKVHHVLSAFATYFAWYSKLKAPFGLLLLCYVRLAERSRVLSSCC